jgi:starvation-inducible DNA-binding protein
MAQAFADTTHQEEKMVLSTRNDLGVEVREKATALLNQLLADATDLYSQTKQAHWNVKGMQFFQLHELFDTLADSVEDYVDLIAERASSLGGTACGPVRLSAAASRLPEYPLDARNGRQHVEALAARFSILAASSRAAIDAANAMGDADTGDVFTEVSRGLNKYLWLLESHLTD